MRIVDALRSCGLCERAEERRGRLLAHIRPHRVMTGICTVLSSTAELKSKCVCRRGSETEERLLSAEGLLEKERGKPKW